MKNLPNFNAAIQEAKHEENLGIIFQEGSHFGIVWIEGPRVNWRPKYSTKIFSTSIDDTKIRQR